MQQKRHIQILKASLPYMHSPLREACRICVRMFELCLLYTSDAADE